MSPAAPISHVMDTAYWMAALRADAAARAGREAPGVSTDPLAAKLAGERGLRIAASMPNRAVTTWGVVTRTSAIDRLIIEAIAAGVDTVVNFGAGLDTRPYRLPLDGHVRWIEVDFPAIVDFKNAQLRGETPSCRVERVGVDVADRRSRGALLASLDLRAASTLAVAEGLVPYLSNEDVASLASDLRGVAHAWLLDFDAAGPRAMPRSWQTRMQAAPFRFVPADWFKFFAACGWTLRKAITSAESAQFLRLPYPRTFPHGLLLRALPHEVRTRILSVSGAALLQAR